MTATRDEFLAWVESKVGTIIPTPGVVWAVENSCSLFTSAAYEANGVAVPAEPSPAWQAGDFQAMGRYDTTPAVGAQFFMDLTGQGRQVFHTGFVMRILDAAGNPIPEGAPIPADYRLDIVDNNGGARDGHPNGTFPGQIGPVGDGFTLGFGHPPYAESSSPATPIPAPAGDPSMSDLVYLAIGHGVEPNGVFDPGAVGADGTTEHDLNTRVCFVADAALTRSGVSHYSEQNGGAGHDPDYRGSVDAVNAMHPALAVEVHFDSGAAPVGGFGIYVSDEGHRLANLIEAAWDARRLPLRASYADNRGLWFLHGTTPPALIWECSRTAMLDDVTVAKMGEAIAEGICRWLGVTYAPPGPAAPTNPGTPGTIPPAAPVVVHSGGPLVDRVSVTIPNMDADGAGNVVLDGRPGYPAVPWQQFRGAYINGGETYPPASAVMGVQGSDHGGHTRLTFHGFAPSQAGVVVHVNVAAP